MKWIKSSESTMKKWSTMKKEMDYCKMELSLDLLTLNSEGQTERLLENIHRWNFSIFTLNKFTNGKALSHLCLTVFHEYDLIRAFNLDLFRWVNFILHDFYVSCVSYFLFLCLLSSVIVVSGFFLSPVFVVSCVVMLITEWK